MATRNRSNPLALAVLACLIERPMHPYEIGQTLRARAKHDSVKLNFGSLYNVVEALEKRGMVNARETVREGRRPERTIYEITDAGSRELTEWLAELVSTPTKEYLQFVVALSFLPGLPPNEALDLLRTRVLALEYQLTQMRAVHDAAVGHKLPRLFLLEGEYEEALLRAELDFVRELVEQLSTGELGGLEEWAGWYAPGAPVPEGPDPRELEILARMTDEPWGGPR